MGLFNRQAAQQYALKWALVDNPAYAHLDYVRGDCTNFVSQIMLAGGWPMVLDGLFPNQPLAWWSKDDGSWSQGAYNKYIVPYFSRAWASASDFANFLELSHRASICTRDELEIGDIVQLAEYGGRLDHTMVVTSLTSTFGGRDANVSYHSRYQFNVSLDNIEARYVGKDTMFYYWKVADVFPDSPA